VVAERGPKVESLMKDDIAKVSGALMTSGKPVIYPEIYYLHDLMWTIGTVCTKTRRRAVRTRARARRRA